MLIPKYKYFINSAEVRPINNKLSKKYERENKEYFFRESIDGTIKLIGSGFQLLANVGLDQELNFTIKKLNTSTNIYEDYYTSTIAKTDCTFNFDTKTCEFKVDKHDRFSAIMDHYEDTIDLLKYGLKSTRVDVYKRPLIQVYVSNSSVLTNFLGGGTYWEQNCESVGDDNKMINYYHFARNYAYHTIRCMPDGLGTADLPSTPGINTVYGDYVAFGVCKEDIIVGDNTFISIPHGPILKGHDKYYVKINVNTLTGKIVSDTSNGVYTYSNNTKIWEVSSISTDLTDAEKAVYANKAIFTLVEGQAVFNEPTTFCVYSPAVEYIYTRLLCDVTTVQGIATHDIPIDDIVENSSNYKYVAKYGLGYISGSTRFSSSEAPYGNNSSGEYYLPPESISGKKYFPVNRASWLDQYSIWFSFSEVYDMLDTSARKAYTLRDGYYIADVIKAMLKHIAPEVKHEATVEYSQFLYADINPLGLQKFYLFLTQKSNLLKGEYDRAAQKAELTFKELMEMLYNCFKLRWFIDTENRLRIEHISWFLNGQSYTPDSANVSIDLTEDSDYKNLKPLAKFQNTITYDKSDLASRFEFSWMDDCTYVFEGTPINVISNYVDKSKIDNISASKFTPDVDYMLAEPSAFSKDGFALLCAIKNNDNRYELPIISFTLHDTFDDGIEYSVAVQNGLASWLYLVNYYMYDMPGLSIEYDYLKAGSLTIKGIKRFMQQVIDFPRAEDPDVYSLIKTERGNGIIDKLSINLINRQVSATLSFTPV